MASSDDEYRIKRKEEVSKTDLWFWFCKWEKGEISKNTIERTVLGDPYSHGKLITRLWREEGWETEKAHPMLVEIQRLIVLCEGNGIEHGSKYS